MYHGLRVAVVVPAYNEQAKLAATLTGIPDYVDHILVVDDASRDDTSGVAEARAAEERARARPGRVELLRHARNSGVGRAIATGYRRALALGADVTCVMAGDGQMDPADLPVLLAPIVAGRADYVKGNRFASPEVWRAMPRLRLVGNIALSLLTRLSSGYAGLFDSQCGYTAATRRALEAIDLGGLFPRYGYPNDLLARLWVAGARVEDAPVRPIYGPAWSSGISVGTAIYPVLFVVLRSLAWRLHATALRRVAPLMQPLPPPMQPGGPPTAPVRHALDPHAGGL